MLVVEERLDGLDIRRRIEYIQTTALLKWDRIFRRIPETCCQRLEKRLHEQDMKWIETIQTPALLNDRGYLEKSCRLTVRGWKKDWKKWILGDELKPSRPQHCLNDLGYFEESWRLTVRSWKRNWLKWQIGGKLKPYTPQHC